MTRDDVPTMAIAAARSEDEPGTVYAVIPVFNRGSLTRQCVRLLFAQTYRSLQIVVADGGSVDGSPAALRREFPGITVLSPKRELWWAGAMAMGIEHVLRVSNGRDDFVLMMNNDTEFAADFVSVLVRVSRQQNAAVGALTLDARDPRKILDAGEFVDWENYSFPVKTEIAPGEVFFDGVDVLPGRGSLVPLEMIRRAGNVDSRRFPHYIADYEFFARLRRCGFRLGVTYETTLMSDPTTTGMAARAGERRSLWRSIQLQLSRRSMNNFLDHYRFIGAAAPRHLVGAVRRRYMLGLCGRALARLGITPLIRFLYLGVKTISWLAVPPYTISAADVEAGGANLPWLLSKGLLARYEISEPAAGSERSVYYLRVGISRARLVGDAAARLFEQARVRGRRLRRIYLLRLTASRLQYALMPVYWVSESDCRRFRVNPADLLANRVARECGVEGYYVLSSRKRKMSRAGAEAAALYKYAHRNRQTLRKLQRLHTSAY